MYTDLLHALLNCAEGKGVGGREEESHGQEHRQKLEHERHTIPVPQYSSEFQYTVVVNSDKFTDDDQFLTSMKVRHRQ